MTDPTTCPYCNSPVTPVDLACPRCGERLGPAVVVPGGVGAAAESEPAAERPPWPRKAVLVAAIGLIGVALGALAYWFGEEQGSQTPDEEEDGPPGVLSDVVRPPAEWPGLAYIPPNSNAVVALRPRMLLGRPAGDALLGERPKALVAVEQAVGFPLARIEEVVIGLTVGPGLTPGWVAVVTANRPFDVSAMREAGRTFRNDDKDFVRLRPGGRGVEVVAWSPGPRTLVVADRADRLDEVPAASLLGVDDLSVTLRTLIRQKLPEAPLAWVVAETDRWNELAAPRVFVAETVEAVTVEDLSHLDAFCLALQPAGDADSLSAWFLLDGEDPAGRLRDYLTRRTSEPAVGGAGPQVSLRLTGTFEELRAAFRRVTQP